MTVRSLSLDGLLMRPRPEPGESWQGYLARLAADNELMGIAALGRVLGVTDTALMCGQLEAGNSFAVTVPDGSRSMLRSITSGRSRLTRICPICIKHPKPIFKACWDRPMTLRCAQHDCMLVDRCNACGAQVRHDRRIREFCNCGQAFSAMTTRPIPKWVRLMEAAYVEAIRIAVDEAAKPITELERAAARALCCFARSEPNAILLGTKSKPYDLTAMVLSEHFETLSKLFLEDDLGVPNAFKVVFAKVSAKNAGSFLHERQLGKFEKIHFALKNLRSTRAKGYIVQWELPLAYRRTHVRLSSLASVLKMSQSNLCIHGPKMLAAYLTEVTCEKTGKSLYLVKRSRVEKIEKECDAFVNFEDAAIRLGIAGSSVRHLAGRNAIASPHQPYLRRFVTHEGLENLTSQIKRHSVVADLDRNERKNLAEAVNELAQRKPTRGANVLLRDIRNGNLPLHVACDNVENLGDYFMRRSDFLRWSEGNRMAA